MQQAGQIVISGETLDLITLDFETFYSADFTLSKMSLSEYIRDEQFKSHGVGIKVGNEKPLWYTGEEIAKRLGELDWSRAALLCHNTQFDGFILSHHYNVVPAFYLDSLAMSRAVHGAHQRHDLDTVAKQYGLGGKTKRGALGNTKGLTDLNAEQCAALGGYCLDDVSDTEAIFWKMYDFMPDDELRLVDITTRMFCDPVLHIDIPRVEQELERELGGKARALKESGVSAERLVSNQKFVLELERLGVTPPTKISPTTGKTTFALAKNDLDFQALFSHPDKRVRAICTARMALKSSIGETRARRFLEAGRDGMKLPVALTYCGAHTTRWSGGNKMNLQNLLRGGELRRSILAPPGYKVVVADSAQIEARILAWLADQMDIIQAFANQDDVYKLMASAIYNKPADQITKDERFIGKVCVLGLGYGMGAKKLRLTLAQGAMGPPVEVTEQEAQRIVSLYRGKNHKITQLWKRMEMILTSMLLGDEGELKCITYGKRFIQLPNGLFLQYPGLDGQAEERYGNLVMADMSYNSRTGRSKIYGGLLTENVTQALARCVVAEQMLEVSDAYRVVTMTHDEIVAIAPAKKAEQCYQDMKKIMSRAPSWAPGLPLAADGGFDDNYSK